MLNTDKADKADTTVYMIHEIDDSIILKLKKLAQDAINNKKNIEFTFDDGLMTQYKYINDFRTYPLSEIPKIFFINTMFINWMYATCPTAEDIGHLTKIQIKNSKKELKILQDLLRLKIPRDDKFITSSKAHKLLFKNPKKNFKYFMGTWEILELLTIPNTNIGMHSTTHFRIEPMEKSKFNRPPKNLHCLEDLDFFEDDQDPYKKIKGAKKIITFLQQEVNFEYRFFIKFLNLALMYFKDTPFPIREVSKDIQDRLKEIEKIKKKYPFFNNSSLRIKETVQKNALSSKEIIKYCFPYNVENIFYKKIIINEILKEKDKKVYEEYKVHPKDENQNIIKFYGYSRIPIEEVQI